VRGLPAAWVETTLGELCSWGSGGTPKRSQASYFGGGIPWVTISDLTDELVIETGETLSAEGLDNSSARLVPAGIVMIALYGSIGKLGLTSRPSTTNQAIAYALPDAVGFNSRYLFHYLRSVREDLGRLGSGVTQKNIYLNDIRSFRISLAPRAEQDRIVAKLEELLSDLDAGVAELKAAQKKLAQYRQSLLKAAVEGALTAEWRKRNPPQETGEQLLQRILAERRARWEAKQLAKFQGQGKPIAQGWRTKYSEPLRPEVSDLPSLPEGWVWASLDHVVAESSYGTSVKCTYGGGGLPVLRIPNISCCQLDLRDLKYANEDLEIDVSDCLAPGDVLVVRTNGSIALVGQSADVSAPLSRPSTLLPICFDLGVWKQRFPNDGCPSTLHLREAAGG
jgi:type I restriction enzyme, S subunit